MDYTLQNAYNAVVSANTLYTDNKERWQFLLESYLGGDDWRRGRHLTVYATETPLEYEKRLAATPYDNHVRGVISTYTSFLFREEPDREFGSLETNPNLKPFLEDADLDGRSLDQFMRDVAIWASVFGHCWVICAKPQSNVGTRADELAQGIRPYVNVLTPLVVTDWTWERQLSGAYELTYLKYLEDVNDTFSTVKEWTKEEIRTWRLNTNKNEVEDMTVEVNGLGKIPAVIAYAARSPVRGIGASLITDIADYCKTIYNLNSEVEGSIRLNGHPTLVKTADVEASAGAGSIALMPDNLDPGLRPYLLNVATDINQIYLAINNSVSAIDKMANTGAVRATESRDMSGVSREVEFQLLNAKLAEIADGLELAEEQIWRIWAAYEGMAWDGEIEYPSAFNIRDTDNEIRQLQIAAQSAVTPDTKALVEYRLRELLDDPRYEISEEEAMEIPEYMDEIAEVMNITDDVAEVMGLASQSDMAMPEDTDEVEAHVMMDPATGATETVTTQSRHEELMALGWIHPEDL